MTSKRKYRWLNESPLKPEAIKRDHVAAIQGLYLAGLSGDQIRGQMIALGYFKGRERGSSVLNFIQERIREIKILESGSAPTLERKKPQRAHEKVERLMKLSESPKRKSGGYL